MELCHKTQRNVNVIYGQFLNTKIRKDMLRYSVFSLVAAFGIAVATFGTGEFLYARTDGVLNIC
jgi:hypothetical protein